ncbi:MAG: PDZ domain-containing protein [Phycisphaera sp.]|nr:PDZ domain-containing protein [Phycisphaera sp.]
MNPRALRALVMCATALALVSISQGEALESPRARWSPAQDGSTGEATRPRVPSQREIDDALRARDFTRAEPLIAARIEAGERDPILLYNHACVLARLGRLEEAEGRLLESVEEGFDAFDIMREDADLEPIREGRVYKAILEAHRRVERAQPERPARRPARDPLAAWEAAHGDRYRYERDEARGLLFATFLDERAHARMRADLALLEEHLLKTYFGRPPDRPALVAIVRPEDASRYLDRPEVKGMYLHSERRLVARDTGQSLQHEFVHLLHFADMERRGQRHPIWIQEGLASLYEDYTLRADGSIEFHPNIRFNIARRQVSSNTARPWKDLFGYSGERFMAGAERHYPQVRAIFEFFAREGKLEEFYRALVETSREDPSGVRAVERTFGEPLARVEARWRKWMLDRGAIDDTVSRGDPSLGLAVEDAVDGARIRSFVPGSAARAAGLRVGDVILSVAGRPVRNRDELMLAVAGLKHGESVEVRYRRDESELAAMVRPRPLGG